MLLGIDVNVGSSMDIKVTVNDQKSKNNTVFCPKGKHGSGIYIKRCYDFVWYTEWKFSIGAGGGSLDTPGPKANILASDTLCCENEVLCCNDCPCN